MKIYIAGPYSQPDPVLNTYNAVQLADLLVKKGHIPFIPHLTLLWHLISPRPIEFWYRYDRVWLQYCNAVFRMVGDSHGADAEVGMAESLGLPVYRNLSEVPDGA